MRRRLLAQSILAALALAFLSPASALAATVTLTDDTSVILPSDSLTYTLNSGGTFDQLDVAGGTMTFTMSAGESVTITAPSQLQLTNDGGFTYTCAAQSTLTLDPSASATIGVTPGGPCAVSGGSSGSSSSSGGRTSTYTPPSAPGANTSRLTSSQIQAILSLLASFHADQSVIDKVRASLGGSGATTASAPTAFTRDLTLGATGADVQALQAYLNTHGYPVATTGPGSLGQETPRFGALTKTALARFQVTVGITPAAGYLGPKTRAYLAGHP